MLPELSHGRILVYGNSGVESSAKNVIRFPKLFGEKKYLQEILSFNGRTNLCKIEELRNCFANEFLTLQETVFSSLEYQVFNL